MFYRFNADEMMFEVVDDKGRVLCMTGTEEEAKNFIEKGDF